MRNPFRDAEEFRVRDGSLFHTKPGARAGLFIIKQETFQIRMIVDDGVGSESGWEHVSVSCKGKYPDGYKDILPPWDCMKMVKMMFWEDEECVLQFFPPQSVYKDDNPSVLHLWRQVGINHPTPPLDLV